jgi:hypothetical protein
MHLLSEYERSIWKVIYAIQMITEKTMPGEIGLCFDYNEGDVRNNVCPVPITVDGTDYIVSRSVCNKEVNYIFINDTTREACRVDESFKITRMN